MTTSSLRVFSLCAILGVSVTFASSAQAFFFDKESFFKDIDADGNGLVSQEEFMAFDPPMKTPTREEKMNRFKTLDANQDGSISLQEFKDG